MATVSPLSHALGTRADWRPVHTRGDAHTCISPRSYVLPYLSAQQTLLVKLRALGETATHKKEIAQEPFPFQGYCCINSTLSPNIAKLKLLAEARVGCTSIPSARLGSHHLSLT